MRNNDKDPQNIKSLFKDALDRHGHPFQYAVIRRSNDLWEKKQSRWVFEASEFPVEVQGYDAKIDFVLSHCSTGGSYGFLVAECKRANPSIRNWLFAKAPYVRRGKDSDSLNVEYAQWIDPNFIATVGTLPPIIDIYHIGLEVKTNVQGDPSDGRGAIERAATQVIRGMNGLIQCISKKNDIKKTISKPAFFVPVIFTTAQLWATDADIAEASLEYGEVDLDKEKVEKKPWLWLQYHMSPTLTHSVIRDESKPISYLYGATIGHLLMQEYSRSIAIVSPDGIDSFLQQSSDKWWG